MGIFGATETLFSYKGSLKAHSDFQESPRPHVCEFVNRRTPSGTHASTHVQVHIHIPYIYTFHQKDRSSKMDKVLTIYSGAK